MAESGRGSIRVHFTQEGLANSGLLETGHPYPNAKWKIDGGTLFIKLPNATNTRPGDGWDFIFGPSKWLSMSYID
ncbi:hypothetical protein [Mycobacterium shigaense]|uniref:hypothetical protein n=1 Tax=Mycobacterium shigaense TaxID=722731 RepID=UPI002ADF0C7B|nr:hypothetical protein [Mycobacterium shigaense]MEA1123893.1 hypothetical protein [Mycobacterium shigaense]